MHKNSPARRGDCSSLATVATSLVVVILYSSNNTMQQPLRLQFLAQLLEQSRQQEGQREYRRLQKRDNRMICRTSLPSNCCPRRKKGSSQEKNTSSLHRSMESELVAWLAAVGVRVQGVTRVGLTRGSSRTTEASNFL